MSRTVLAFVLLILALAGPAGCVRSVSGAAEPGAQVGRLKTFHVVEGQSQDVTAALRDELLARGFTVTTGTDAAAPTATECKVRWTDRWMWDMTMYPLEINVELVDPRSGTLLAKGRSYRTSLVRTSPRNMAKEIFDKIFATAKPEG